VKAITKMLANMEPESGGDTENAIIEAIDFKPLVASLSGDPQIVEALKDAVKSAIENTDGDNLGETVDEAFGLNDSERLVQTLGKDAETELQKVVADKVREMIKDWDSDQLDDDTKAEMQKAIFSEERVAAALTPLGEEAKQALVKFASAVVEHSDPNDGDDCLTQLVLESAAIKAAVETAAENLNRTGRLDRLIEDAVTQMLSADDSAFREKIEEAVSEKLTEMVGKMTESVVTRLFETRR
jgi:hypothetical protein